MDRIERLSEIIAGSEKIVFFGGAGVSTESGIPDFRSVDGLYNQKWKYPPETILSHTFFMRHTEEFYRFYLEKMNCMGARPNAAHLKLAELERDGKLKAIVTQNIDGLHQQAGSKEVYELHGSVHRNYCTKCGKFYEASYVFGCGGVPYCDCGGLIKPDVVLYEEPLNEDVIDGALYVLSECDTLIIGGTSLNVYPAAGFIGYFKGKNLVIINKSPTQYDERADLLICDNIGEVFSKIRY